MRFIFVGTASREARESWEITDRDSAAMPALARRGAAAAAALAIEAFREGGTGADAGVGDWLPSTDTAEGKSATIDVRW